MSMKDLNEIFTNREIREFKKFKRETGQGLNEVQMVVAYIRYFRANIRTGVYYRKGSGRKAIAKRTGLPEYEVQIILNAFRDPGGSIPKLNNKYQI